MQAMIDKDGRNIAGFLVGAGLAMEFTPSRGFATQVASAESDGNISIRENSTTS
jgi:hypothetical protein